MRDGLQHERSEDAFVQNDLLIQLPATLVNSVTSILLDAQKADGEWTGEETTDFDLNASGLIRVYDVGTTTADLRSASCIMPDSQRTRWMF